MTNQEIYLARAAEAQQDADQAILANVRDRALRSQAAWADMADRADKMRARIEAEKTASREALIA